MKLLGIAMLGAALVFSVFGPALAIAQAGRLDVQGMPAAASGAVIVYTAPASATWGPSPGAPPTFAFGKPAEVLLVVPGGYVVQQRMPAEQAMEHATYVSGQLGQTITVTIPDPAGGAPRVEYVGTVRNDR